MKPETEMVNGRTFILTGRYSLKVSIPRTGVQDNGNSTTPLKKSNKPDPTTMVVPTDYGIGIMRTDPN